MKVVINACHGGFSLSPKAVELYAKKKKKKCYFFTHEYENGKHKYIPFDGYPTGIFWSAATTKKLTTENYDKSSIDVRPDDRTDPILVEVIEELGVKANGAFAKLKIIEIPHDVKWHIEEYDGWETIHEDHRVWE